MRFKGLDLNLLVALNVLLDERSVARSAERLHLSQPAVSAALGRLRAYFGDPILVQHGKRMIPSARAFAIKAQLANLLTDIDALVMQSATFDPATSDRWFRIGVSDYLCTVVFARLLPELQRLAPSIRIELQPPSDAMNAMLEQGELDLVITPEDYCVKDHPAQLLFEERMVVAGAADNPVICDHMTEDQFYASGHVAVALGRVHRASFAETYLRARGRERRIEVLTGAFSLVPDLLAGTSRIAVMHERLAKTLAERLPVRWCALPFELPVMREMMQFHQTRSADPGLQWLIAEIQRCADQAD